MHFGRFAKTLPLVALPIALLVASRIDVAAHAHAGGSIATTMVVEEQALLLALTEAERCTRHYVIANGVGTTGAYDEAIRRVDRHAAHLHEISRSDATRSRRARELETLVRQERVALRDAVLAERSGRHDVAGAALASADRNRIIDRLRSASATFDLAELRRAGRRDGTRETERIASP